MGGSGPCNVMAVDPLPEVLELMSEVYPGSQAHREEGSTDNASESRADGARNTEKEDLSSHVGGQQAFMVHNILTPAESNALIEVAELCGFSEAAPDISTPPGMRMNLTSHWVAPRAWMQKLFERFRHLLPQEIEGKRLLGLSCRLNTYKYFQNMHFKKHVDGDWPAYEIDRKDGRRMVVLDGRKYGHSKLSMLVYLNDSSGTTELDGVEGGCTRLYKLDGEAYDVMPHKGAALFFRHGRGDGSVLHEGCPVKGERPKYVARINVMYEI